MDEFELELNKIELTDEVEAKLRAEQSRLVKIVEAFEGLEKSKEWGVLKDLVFSKSLEAIERQLMGETLNKEISIEKLYRLQGEWAWARQYANTDAFIETLKKQLEGIKNKLK